MKEKKIIGIRIQDTPNMSFVARVPLEREPRSSSPPQTCYVVWCGEWGPSLEMLYNNSRE